MDDLVTVKIKRETLNAIQNIAYELETQDNRATAKPYFLVIRTKKWRVCLEDYTNGDTKTVRVDTQSDPREFETKEEYVDYLKDVNPDIPTQEEIDQAWDDLPEFTLEAYYDEDNVFLTDKGFEEHVRQNGHNLGRRGEEYHTYVKHAYRNPEMNAIFDLIQEIGSNK